MNSGERLVGGGQGHSGSGNHPAAEAGKVRLYEVAKDLGLANKDLVAKVRALGIEVKNHMSNLDVEDVARVKRALDKERQANLVEERLSSTVIRRRSKDGQQLRPGTPVPSAPSRNCRATSTALTVPTALMRWSPAAAGSTYPPEAQMPSAPIRSASTSPRVVR